MSYLTRATLFSAVLINGAGNAESPILDLRLVARLEGLILQASSVTGTADVKVQLSTSHNGVAFDNYADNPDVVSSTLLAKPTAPEGFNTYAMPAPLSPYAKLKVTGVGTNPADTLITGYVMMREGRE